MFGEHKTPSWGEQVEMDFERCDLVGRSSWQNEPEQMSWRIACVVLRVSLVMLEAGNPWGYWPGPILLVACPFPPTFPYLSQCCCYTNPCVSYSDWKTHFSNDHQGTSRKELITHSIGGYTACPRGHRVRQRDLSSAFIGGGAGIGPQRFNFYWHI